ncbi:MAG: ROK family transcriptional regulator [Firmicutes bacterium]|nr:ROK family transcriptional regulator [Bacillota bacterium]
MRNKARNSTDMKFYNRNTILKIIQRSPVSRAELARKTGLTRAAVSLIIDELIKEGIVVETGTGEAEYGRKPVLLEINPDCYYVVGLNISRSGYSTGIVDIKGNLKSRYDFSNNVKASLENELNHIKYALNKLIKNSGIEEEKILGLGISAPGPLDVYNGIILNPPNFSLWHGVNIIDELKKDIPLKMFLENNSTALTLAEKNIGKGPKFSNFILIVVDTGIGAGIVIDDKLYRGEGGFGCEIGHTTIDVNGKACSCGNTGCLEVYASIPAVLQKAAQYDNGIKSWKDIVDKAEQGNNYCLKIIKEEARLLAAAIVNIINILELEAVVLTGYINYKPNMLMDLIREYVGKTAITRNIRSTKIYSSSLDENSDIIAAAAVVIDKFFSYPHFLFSPTSHIHEGELYANSMQFQ